MTLAPHEFIRHFLLHVLPHGLHRIRRYGLLASSARKPDIERARELLAVRRRPKPVEAAEPIDWLPPVPAAAGACASSRPSNADAAARAAPRSHSNRDAS